MRLAEIGLAWFAYFVLHSLLAASATKACIGVHFPRAMPVYRAAYNVVASLALLPVLWLVYATPSAWLWQWRGPWLWLADGCALISLLCFYLSARSYDMGEFLGLRQWAARSERVVEHFTISPFHRFVRHPWYCFGLVLLWTRDMNGPILLSAIAITLYFILGSRLEERKLTACFGQAYQHYMARVPGLIPLPWRYLTRAQADALSGHCNHH